MRIDSSSSNSSSSSSSTISSMTSVNIREDDDDVVVDGEKEINGSTTERAPTLSEGDDSKEDWSFFEGSKRNEDDGNDKGQKESPNSTSGIEESPDLTSEPEENETEEDRVGSTKSHDSSVFLNQNGNAEDCYLLPKPNEDGNFRPSDGATITSDGRNDVSDDDDDDDVMRNLGVDLLMERSALTGRLSLRSESRSADETSDAPVAPTDAPVKTPDAPVAVAPEVKIVRAVPFSVRIAIVLVVLSNAICLVLLGRERMRRTEYASRLESEIESLRQVYETRERAAAERVVALESSLEKYQRSVLPWEDPKDESDGGLVIDNCWIRAQASLQLGECPYKYREILSDYFGLEHWFEEDAIQKDASFETNKFEVSKVDDHDDDDENATDSKSEPLRFQVPLSEELQGIWNRIDDIGNDGKARTYPVVVDSIFKTVSTFLSSATES